MPPPASKTKAVIQKFAIVTHVHGLPVCTARRHSSTCKSHGIWLGCKKIGRRIIVDRSSGEPKYQAVYDAVCTHLRR